MNRPINITQPDSSVIAHAYNKAGLLETIKSQLRGVSTWTDFITNINYNEKGQRTEIYYDNGSKTSFYYDTENFRLTRLLTTRNTGSDILQDISYTYDPEGNITEIEDNAQQTFYYSNSVIDPKGKYYYDALYRLTKATGRELTSLAMPTDTDFANNLAVPNTASNAMQNYTQEYSYDELGNINEMKSIGDWTRDYFYNTADNYLLGHTNGTTEYTYDAHGNTLSMPHLTSMDWDYKDQLIEVDLGGGGTAYYTYDAGGERARKVIVKTGGIIEQRIYLGGYEVFRKTISGTLDFERETLRISDDRKAISDIETKTVENGSSIQNPVSSIRYQYDNHLGSACLELDSNAAIISYEEYHPFGTTSYRSGRTLTEVSLKRYKYVGKEKDEETGLYYYGARYYAGWICRFVSVDPLARDYPQLTSYNYAGNKPIAYIDIDGMQAEGDPPRGKVINVHKEEMRVADEAVKINNEKVNNLKNNPISKEVEGYDQYKQELKSANTALKYAKADLKTATKHFNQVEELLNEYAYYDPAGYKQLHEYTDYQDNPIDVYVGIDTSIKIIKSAGRLDYGEYGTVDAQPYSYDNGKFATVESKEFGMNSIHIKLAPNNYSTTIAHEKGHFDSLYFDYEKDMKFVKEGGEHYVKGRHGDGDPSGIRAENETAQYRKKIKAVKSIKDPFDKYNPQHYRKY
jgi:RHS repeat-associated protein